MASMARSVQQRSAHDFDRPLRIISDRRKRKATAEAQDAAEQQPIEFFWRISAELRRALVRTARRDLSGARATARQDRRSHDEEKLSRREEAL